MNDGVSSLRPNRKINKPMSSKYVVVFITVESREAAQKIAEVMLDQRKAACVNILSAMESHYWWQRKKEIAQEILLIVKTRAKLLNDLVALVKKHH
jgi:periplasmic divalent cation tolerance protein